MITVQTGLTLASFQVCTPAFVTYSTASECGAGLGMSYLYLTDYSPNHKMAGIICSSGVWPGDEATEA